MNGYKTKALRAYQEAQVNTADQLSLITMLYQGAIKFSNQAIYYIESRDIETAHFYISRVQDIITELLCSLDINSKNNIVKDLLSLYEFMYRQMVAANLNKDKEPIKQVVKLLEQLLSGWIEVKKARNDANSKQDSQYQKQKVTSIYG